VFLTICAIITFCLIIGYDFLAFSFRKGFVAAEKTEPSSHRPMVTIIVPAHNEEKTLPRLLDCLSRQVYPRENTEIFLVNDRSTDLTAELMGGFVSQHKYTKVFHIDTTPAGISPKKHAIATAISHASGEIIFTTDADASPKPGWISGMVRRYDEQTGMVLGYAPYRTDGPFRTLFHRLLALDYFAMGAVAAAGAGVNHPVTCNGANLSYRKCVFDEVGGFGETAKYVSGDDDLLLHRIHEKTDWKIRFCTDPETVVFNDPPGTIWRFIRQRIRFASKHLAYPWKVRAVLAAVYVLHVLLLVLLTGSIFSLSHLPFFLALFGMKAGCELFFLYRGYHLLEKRNLLILYPVAAIPYLFYVVLFPLLGQIIRSRW
jgi:cellulose synthase/poly-beta-1,6-N-acetylglucosamine synthase-like glycosyltransferase